MHGPVLIDDRIAVRGEGSTERGRLVQRFAMLLERDDAQLVGAGDGACVRLQRAGQQFQQCGLPASIRTQQSKPLSRSEQQIEIFDDRLPAQRFAELGGLD